MYDITFDQAPAYELVVSLYTYLNKKIYKELDMGKEWVKETGSQLSADLSERLEGKGCCERMREASLLVWRCQDERTAEGFLAWLERQSPGDLFELLAPWMDACPSNIGNTRDWMLSVLTDWHEQYFRHVDPAIFAGLARDKEEKSSLLSDWSAPDIVEEVSGGLYLRPSETLKQVVLAPQYHASPVILLDAYGPITTLLYPSDAYMTQEDMPPRALLRVARCLADESRLRILRFLTHGPRTFTEIVGHIGLAKSTVSYHMIMLRGAGLVRAYAEGECVQEYTLRKEGLKKLGSHLLSFLKI
ncbi:ArsR/SmtB family transcription factor [Aneurinibacillus sp. REN35]|uniref:ArsR/SmtB family transcription factor n=1 Tax=Aneurinibacillus sp. REN35 TaxID=3237286 RepID=UPI003529920F